MAAAAQGGERRRRAAVAGGSPGPSPSPGPAAPRRRRRQRPRLNPLPGGGRGSAPPPPPPPPLSPPLPLLPAGLAPRRPAGDRRGSGGAPRPSLRVAGEPRTALRHCGLKTSVASMFMAEWPRPVCCSMVPTTGALQQCSGISPPVLVDHPDGCKPAEEI